MGRKAHPLAARIKKMMQTDEDVGKIAHATPVMIARAMELFLGRLCSNAAEVAANRKAKTLTTSHLKAYVSSDELMDFLMDTVQKAPDLPERDADAPKPKRQRTEGKREARTSAEGKRTSADGAKAKAAAAAAVAAAAAGEPSAPASAVAAAPEALQAKHEDTGSPSAQAAHAKLGHGFGGLGAHPFLAARSFGKPGSLAAKHRTGSSSSPNPDAVAHKQQQQEAPADGSGGSADEDDSAAAEYEQQQQQQPAVGQQPGGEVAPLPGLPGMLSVQALASFKQQDDFEEDYDS